MRRLYQAGIQMNEMHERLLTLKFDIAYVRKKIKPHSSSVIFHWRLIMASWILYLCYVCTYVQCEPSLKCIEIKIKLEYCIPEAVLKGAHHFF